MLSVCSKTSSSLRRASCRLTRWTPAASCCPQRPTRPQHFHASRGPEVEPEAARLLNASSINDGGAELEDESDVGDDPLDLGQYNVLQRVTASHVRMHPFPHLVVRQALPADVYAKLAGSFPGEDVMTEWRHTPRAGRAVRGQRSGHLPVQQANPVSSVLR